MKIKTIYLICFLWVSLNFYGQDNTYTGFVKNKSNNELLEFVSIGVIGKELGTVSSIKGDYSLEISHEFDQDSIKFSCIGFLPFVMQVAEYKALRNNDIFLEPKDITLKEVIVFDLKKNILGNRYDKKTLNAGFEKNNKGFECGVLLDINKRTYLQELVCNIAYCTYDSVYYRVNIYKETGKDFTNILDQPIYFKEKIGNKKTLSIDLSKYNIMVEGNTLITLEHIIDMRKGHLLFCGSPYEGSTCYYRKKSHSKWKETPIKMAFYVKVLEEYTEK